MRGLAPAELELQVGVLMGSVHDTFLDKRKSGTYKILNVSSKYLSRLRKLYKLEMSPFNLINIKKELFGNLRSCLQMWMIYQ